MKFVVVLERKPCKPNTAGADPSSTLPRMMGNMVEKHGQPYLPPNPLLPSPSRRLTMSWYSWRKRKQRGQGAGEVQWRCCRSSTAPGVPSQVIRRRWDHRVSRSINQIMPVVNFELSKLCNELPQTLGLASNLLSEWAGHYQWAVR